MKTILMSIRKEHVDDIKAGRKRSELRLRAPAQKPPYRVIVYEPKVGGGSGKVVLEFVCHLEHLHYNAGHSALDVMRRARVSYPFLRNYTHWFTKSFTEMFIGDLVVYDQPRELSEYGVKRAPQSWMYLKEGDHAN